MQTHTAGDSQEPWVSIGRKPYATLGFGALEEIWSHLCSMVVLGAWVPAAGEESSPDLVKTSHSSTLLRGTIGALGTLGWTMNVPTVSTQCPQALHSPCSWR